MTRAALALALALVLAACNRGEGKVEAEAGTAPAERAAAAAFMAKAAAQPGVQKLPSGVLYKVLRSGPGEGLRPKLGDEVKFHYELKLSDGKLLESSFEQGIPATAELRELIPAWQQALQLMRPGDEWMLWVPPEQGYGAEGAGGGEIPPNAPLVFRIELVGVLPGPGSILKG